METTSVLSWHFGFLRILFFGIHTEVYVAALPI